MALNIVFGGENIRDKILTLLKENKIEFKHLKHNPALTSEQGVENTNIPKEKGIKSLIVKGKKSGNHYLIAILGHQKLNMKALAKIIKEKCEIESLVQIKFFFGLDQGGVCPFGNLLGLKTFFDEDILKLDECIIGTGLATESIIINVRDLVKIIQPEIYRISK